LIGKGQNKTTKAGSFLEWF